MPAASAVDRLLDAVVAEVRALGLESNLAELEALGLTVVPPDRAAAPGFTDRLLKAVLRLATERHGEPPDIDTGSTHADIPATAGQRGETWLWRLLFEDPVFEEALMNPVQLALVTSLLGYRAKLSNSSAVLKGPVECEGAPVVQNLHSDNRGIPAPFPTFAQVANATWALSDYTLDNGCVGFVPSSHLLCRQPAPGEGLDAVVPVEAEAGSLIVWHGNTWHAPYPRTTPGLRVSLLFYFCREYLVTQERYGEEVPRGMLERNDPRFATLMGLDDPYGWDAAGPDMPRLRASTSGQSLHS